MSTEFHGVVFVKDGTKAPEEYGVNREVNITIEFNAENEAQLHALLDAAADKANAKVDELLGRKSPKVATKPQKVATVAKSDELPRTKADIEREAGLTPGKDAHVKPQPAPKASPQSLDDLEDVEIVTTAAPVEEDLSDILGEEVPQITDEDLLSKITHANGRTKNSVAIRKLVDDFTPNDRKYQAREIVQDKRAAFLTALEAVPKLVTAGA